MIRVNADGSINESEVREYSKSLSRIERDIEGLKDIQAVKSRKEVEKLEEQIAKLRFERQKEQGKFVPKEDVDLKIVSTLTVLDAHFRRMLDMNMPEVCRLLGGENKRLNDARDFLDQNLDEMLNKLSNSDSFTLEMEEV